MVCGRRSVEEAHSFTVVDVGAGRLFLIPIIVIISHNVRRATLRLFDNLRRGVATEKRIRGLLIQITNLGRWVMVASAGGVKVCAGLGLADWRWLVRAVRIRGFRRWHSSQLLLLGTVGPVLRCR